MKNRAFKGIALMSFTVLLTACGGANSANNATVNSNGTVSHGGSVSGGTSKIPSIVGTPCKKTQTIKGTDADTTLVSEKGATGSIIVDCNNTSSSFQLKQAVVNLNISSGSVVDYWFCSNKQGKGLVGWIYKHDLTKGKSKMIWTEGGKAYINCHSSYPSPLPKTVTSKRDLADLSKYGIDQKYDYTSCTYSTTSTSTGVSCNNNVSDRFVTGNNAILIENNGKTHKTSERNTWITTKH